MLRQWDELRRRPLTRVPCLDTLAWTVDSRSQARNNRPIQRNCTYAISGGRAVWACDNNSLDALLATVAVAQEPMCLPFLKLPKAEVKNCRAKDVS